MIACLDGVRVLDLTNVLAGPFCCHQLAHMGADVIKVEVPGSGDLARQLGADAELNAKHMGVSFLAQNAGKRSLTLNLKSAKGKAIFRRLVATADVVVENFRPGVMERLGLGFETLTKDRPDLIYCAISGFGQEGPLRNLPAYDQIIQGMCGVMSITGDAETAPYRVGYPIADTIGGMTAAFAVAAALARRGKAAKEPCLIDVSMLEATLATMGWVVSNLLIAGRAPQPLGNENFTASPSGAFRTGEGLLNIAANKQEQFEAVCRVLGRPELAADPRFAARQDRLARRTELKAILEEALAARSAADWQEDLNAAGVPAGRVLTVPEALDHPQVRDRGMIAAFEAVPGVERDIRLVRTGIKVNGAPPAVESPPPQLGEHSREILAELGLSDMEIDALAEEKAL
ncbi:CaiB/BaiF CoA-transferase family protein [Pelagibius sp.]|uniref:CaiB/BaiF CoA transferase family protein n=1 Tax=Pelagibius sp. TaxID=1931238 RepID=UPI00261BFB7A|nr:CoA transferase [Pelagibius sp.]